MRLLLKPEPVEEVVAMVPDGPPARFRWRCMLHEVVRVEGPERIADEWWRTEKSRPTRDYYRVEDKEGRRFWLFREGLFGREHVLPRWFMHGTFA
jgi:protein ImuB